MTTVSPAPEPIDDEWLAEIRADAEESKGPRQTIALLARLDAAEANARRMREALKGARVFAQDSIEQNDASLSNLFGIRDTIDNALRGGCEPARAALKEGGE